MDYEVKVVNLEETMIAPSGKLLTPEDALRKAVKELGDQGHTIISITPYVDQMNLGWGPLVSTTRFLIVYQIP
jgi:hypothetical protein